MSNTKQSPQASIVRAKSHRVSRAQVRRFIWRYVRSVLPWLIVMLVLSLLGTGAVLAQPFFYRAALDAIASNTPDKTTAMFAMRMVLFGILMGAITLSAEQCSNFLLGRIEAPLMRRMHADVFAHVQKLSSQFHVDAFAGSTARKITRGVDSIETILDRVWQNFLPACIVVIGLFFVLWSFAPIIGVVLTLGLLGYVFLSIILTLFIGKYYTWVDRQETRVTGSLVDALTGNALVKACASEKVEEERHGKVVGEWQRRQMKAWSISTVIVLLQFYYLLTLEAVILLLALWLWYKGQFTPGGFLVVSMYVWLLWARLFDIGRHIRDYLRAIAHIEEMVELAQRKMDIADDVGARELRVTRGEIQCRNVAFKYESQDVDVLSDFSLTIKAGEKVALVGHSGGGKSTIVKLLLRLHDVQSGSVMIDGQDIRSVTQRSLRKNIGLVPQDPILFHRSIRENILYGQSEASQEEMMEAAKNAFAHDFIMALPKGYDTLVGERGVKLSGGERQRVAIARAMLANKPILILDEATSSLDSRSETYIQRALIQLMQHRTSIVIAHRLSTIKHVDRILVIENGRIVEQGSHEELLRREKGAYRHFYELQAGGFLGEDED